eukprot:scaffold25879_cov28-Tisochrysis_lutea.AAC.5
MIRQLAQAHVHTLMKMRKRMRRVRMPTTTSIPQASKSWLRVQRSQGPVSDLATPRTCMLHIIA